ncbi:hypothetical protein KJ765_01810 [Candidatus Micrarchaeota archaeon]|nr:hypothetical protein [Candidatus Micrarchaeota archaeon]
MSFILKNGLFSFVALASLVLAGCTQAPAPAPTASPVPTGNIEESPSPTLEEPPMPTGVIEPTDVPGPTEVPVPSEDVLTFTMGEIAQHGSAEDCWLLIDGKVYDVNPFIAGGNHGGGDAILQGCGIDSTELFNTRPMGSGTSHSEKARSFLPNFYIGEFAG